LEGVAARSEATLFSPPGDIFLCRKSD
jgi:hypothetical protein